MKNVFSIVRILILSFLIFLPAQTAFSVSSFMQLSGGSALDKAMSVEQAINGDFIVAGYTKSYGMGSADGFLSRYDSFSNSKWEKTIGGLKSERIYCVKETNDEGLIIAGFTESYGAGDDDILIAKFTKNGEAQWIKTFGGLQDEWAKKIIQTPDGGYAVSGGTKSYGAGDADVFLLKIDGSGNFEWMKVFGGKRMDYATSVIQLKNGGFLLSGGTDSYGSITMNQNGVYEGDLLLIKCDGNGNLQWAKAIGEDRGERAYNAIETDYGNFIVGGITDSYSYYTTDILTLNFTEQGELFWAKRTEATGPEYDNAIEPTSDGGFVVATRYKHPNGIGSGFLVKYNTNGDIAFAKEIDLGSQWDELHAVKESFDGGFVMAGSSYSGGAGVKDVLFMKTDSRGNINGCDYIKSISPSTYLISPTITSAPLSQSSVTPSVSSPSMQISSFTPDLSVFCIGDNVSNGWARISGTVTYLGAPVCAMILANGQYMFTCGDNNGEYDLTIPVDGNGEITLFAFVDGLAPFKQVLTPEAAANFNIQMELASPDSKTPTVTSTVVESIDNPGWAEIEGSVSLGGTPLCAMVLANGQYMFSCDGNGEYQLSVPLDGNGEITLFTFVDGLQPYKEIISP